MNIKSNTVLSDNELWRIETILRESINPKGALEIVFPNTKIVIDADTIYIGSPPWDLTQEVTV